MTSRLLKNIQTVKTRKPSVLQSIVLDWFSKNGRDFPWRSTNNAFFILIAESLLRQTQAERVVEPYLNLIARFSDPQSLAHANIAQFREWFHPLGLVGRANHLVETSKILVCHFSGKVPDSLEQLKELPGLGEYSSRAVLCLAYNIQVPMVDESSGRLLRRIFALHSKRPAYSDPSLLELARELLPKGLARDFNLGLIDIAAAYCHSKNPECSPCPLFHLCNYGRNCAV
jgi:A/G-specific adenine glycosylase